MFNDNDLKVIEKKGIKIYTVEKQIDNFKKSFPFADIVEPATISNGINKIEDTNKYIKIFEQNKENKQIVRFVPASGAASRMFKNLFEFLNTRKSLSDDEFVNHFYKNLKKFAFYDVLNLNLMNNLIRISEENIYLIIDYLLSEKGLNYGHLPKGLLLFHKYEKQIRTSFEEHLVEAAKYAKGKNNLSKLSMTVSPEHKDLFIKLFEKVKKEYENNYNTKFEIEFTLQSSSTDTIAVNLDNTPYRDENGNLFFRPGGHGALIHNLNYIDADIIFIKNIDNVAHENYITDTVEYKKIIAGVLIEVQEKINDFLNNFDANADNIAFLDNVQNFLEKDLFIKFPEKFKNLSNTEKSQILKQKLNRPLRVCGMVKNEGEPGGGPFFVKSKDKSIQLQIVESAEIAPENKQIMQKSTHFNPVDIVCSTKDFSGRKFDLHKFVNNNAGFISEKSINGKAIKALELPGLWNGAMANWNTIFVEVPISTFNPVKTVNDLLKKHHQA